MDSVKTGALLARLREVHRRRRLGWIAALVALALMIAMVGMIDTTLGSTNCVIAEDYSNITYCGEIYVPLDTGSYACRVGRELVREAAVENAPLIGKLLFGDTVYEAAGTPDGTLLYLQTEYDLAPSPYYVRQSQQAQMERILDDFTDAQLYGVITQKDWNEKEILLEDGLPAMHPAGDQAYDAGCSQWDVVIPVVVYEPNHIFYRMAGEILYLDGAYYWYDRQGDLYLFEDSGTASLDVLRAYMFQ